MMVVVEIITVSLVTPKTLSFLKAVMASGKFSPPRLSVGGIKGGHATFNTTEAKK